MLINWAPAFAGATKCEFLDAPLMPIAVPNVAANRPVACLTTYDATVDNLSAISGVRWKTNPPSLTRPVTERPKVEGVPVSDWVVVNRR